MALTRRGLLFAVGDAHVYTAPEAAKGDGLGYAAPRKRERAQVPGCAGSTRAFLAKCVNCNLCVRACPNGCIPPDREKKVDHSRCVSCFACAGVCGKGALTWR